MKNLCAASILILVFCAVSFAQTNQNSPCPNIEVRSPTFDTSPGTIITFTAIVDKENEKMPLSFQWIVSNGEILEGQGTSTIKTQQKPEDVGKSTTATVNVKVLPDGCEVSSSETATTWCPPLATEIDEFSIPAIQIDKTKLNNLAIELRNNPSAQIYIIERFEKKTLLKTIERKNQKTTAYLKESGMDISRFTFINGYSDKTLTQIFLVPSGAMSPVCDDCEDIEPK